MALNLRGLRRFSEEEVRRYRRSPFFARLKNSEEARERTGWWRWWYSRGCSLPREGKDDTH